jgi:hypothetical protein
LQEILRHDFDCFVGNKAATALSCHGCPACKKRINTMNQFLDHLAEDAMPALIERLATKSSSAQEFVAFSAYLRLCANYYPIPAPQ